MDPTQSSCRVFFPYWGFFCYVIALDVPLVLAGGLLYHVLLELVLARLKLLCSSLFLLFRLSITLHFLQLVLPTRSKREEVIYESR